MISQYDVLTGENELIVYKFNNSNTLLINGIIECPACGGFLDLLIGCGVTDIMFCGGGEDITVGKFIVVDGAIRDEGFSYHLCKTIKNNKS